MNRPADFLRSLSALAILVCGVAFFDEPIEQVARRHLPALSEAGEDDPVPELGEMPPAPTPSFLLEIISVPSGAVVTIGAGERGRTPAVVNVRCAEGEEVAVSVEAAGHERWSRRLACDPGETVTLRAELRR